jgi:hypothetical protein
MVITFMFNKKRDHFKKMKAQAEQVIWELEFKKFTALYERETVRKQYDQLQDAFQRISAQLANEVGDKDSLAKLESEKVEVEKNLKDTKDYMDSIDATISGGPASALLPNGAPGIDNQLRGWVTKRDYINSFIEHNT